MRLLVACSKGKAEQGCAALDLYQGPMFRLRRRWCVEVHGREPDAILSARYGALDPRVVVEPYDQTIDSVDREQWGAQVAGQLDYMFGRGGEFLLLGGAGYFRVWPGILERNGATVRRRKHGGIGLERSNLAREISLAVAPVDGHPNSATGLERSFLLAMSREDGQIPPWDLVEDAMRRAYTRRMLAVSRTIEEMKASTGHTRKTIVSRMQDLGVLDRPPR